MKTFADKLEEHEGSGWDLEGLGILLKWIQDESWVPSNLKNTLKEPEVHAFLFKMFTNLRVTRLSLKAEPFFCHATKDIVILWQAIRGVLRLKNKKEIDVLVNQLFCIELLLGRHHIINVSGN